MHSFAVLYNSAKGLVLIYGVFINSLFNACVSIFILISGYFGVRTSVRKLFRLWVMAIFCSLFNVVVKYTLGNINDTGELVKMVWRSIFPISSVRYWYITSYFILVIFANYINAIPERLERKQFENLIILLLVIFSVLPTFTSFHVMNDGGKGFANMFLMYLIGRYIRIYSSEISVKGNKIDLNTCRVNKLALIVVVTLIIEFILNLMVSLFRGGIGVGAPFARDCSILIVVLAIAIFLLFLRIHFVSRIVNQIASHVLGVYLLENTVRTVLGLFFDIGLYGECWYLFAIISVYAMLTFFICVVIDLLYKVTIERVVNMVLERVNMKGF